MSKWIDNFDNHPFILTWTDLKAKLELSEVDETISVNVIELSRLKKVITFIDNIIQNIDPELLPVSVLNNLNNQSIPCRDQINAYNSNKNINHIVQSNAHCDNLLTYISPYIIYADKLEKPLLNAVRSYTSEIDKHLKKITDTESEYTKVKQIREDIESYHNSLFDVENSIKSRITSALDTSEAEYQKINLFYNETLIDEEHQSTKTVIVDAKKDILRDTEEANKKLIEVSGKIEELDKFYTRVFGSDDESGNKIGGLKKEIDEKLIALENFKREQEKIYTEQMNSRLESLTKYEQGQQENNRNLYEQIESHLPGATTAGLSKAYQEMKDSFNEPIKKWNIVFISSVGLMVLFTFLSYVNIGNESNGVYTLFTFIKMGDVTNTLNSLLFKLPLYAPLIWIALYASKRRSENQRLHQEYAHKESLAKSYVSYKMQIDELNQTDKELLEKLLESSISTVAYNASESLDKKHGDSTPAQETIKMFVEQVKKLKS